MIDDDGAVVKRWLTEHTEDALVWLFGELAEFEATALPIAIERGEGLIVGLIGGAGHPVMMVEPSVNLPGSCGGSDPWEGWSYVKTWEIPGRAA